jgi:hypothetical protein
MGYDNVARASVTEVYDELSFPIVRVSRTIRIDGRLLLEDLLVVHNRWTETVHRYAVRGAGDLR